jgi:hypothetical protein
MFCYGVSRWKTQLAGAACVLAAGLLAGCDSRSLSWSYLPDAPALVQPGRPVALVGEYDDYRGPGRIVADLTNSLASDLMTRGYRVSVLAGGPPAVVLMPAQPQPPAPPAPPQPPQPPMPPAPPLPPQPPQPPTAAPPAGPGPSPFAQARYAAARDINAAFLLELHVSITEEVYVNEGGGPYRHRWRTVTVTPLVPHATLRISRPQDQTLVGSVTVRYDDPTGDPAKVAADLCMGLDFIRQGAPPQQVILKGSGGDVTVKVVKAAPNP